MKRFFAAVTAVLLILTACSESSESMHRPDESPSKTVSNTSSVFGRSVKYYAVSPAEGLALPVPAAEIKDIAQIETALYLLTEEAVYFLDIKSGESGKLFDASASAISAHGGKLYAYFLGDALLSEYDPSSGSTNGIPFPIESVDSVEEMEVTDSYAVFKCVTKGEKLIETNILIYSRETKEQTLSKPAPNYGISFFPYKGDKLLSVTENAVFGYMQLSEYDPETGKSKSLQELDTRYYPGVVYSQKTDTAIMFGVPYGAAFEDDTAIDDPCMIAEYSLSDTDGIVLNRYHIAAKYGTVFFVGIYENIVWAVSTASDECIIYDYLNPPESITILGHASDDIIYAFEKESGILVRIAKTDDDKRTVKLMAGDSDFDIFNAGTGFQNYLSAGTFVDLTTVESLNSRISGNKTVEAVVSCDGKYFGVPISISNYCTEENFPENGSNFSYSLVVSENIYLAENVDVAEARYSDPSGDELYKLFKYFNDNPTGSRKKMPFGDSVTMLTANVYLMNPKSQNYGNAVKFLEFLFDVYNGDIKGVVPESDLYPELEPDENCYVEWRCRPIEYVTPIFTARNEILGKNGEMSASELKRLAKETAAEVAMRIGE